MKKLLFIFAIILSGMTIKAQNIIKTGPIALAFGSFNACYEMVLSENTSIQPSASVFFGIEGSGTVIGLGLGYRWYLSKTADAPHGFYIMPRAGYNFGSDAGAIGLGAELGYQWIMSSGFAVDLGIGPQYFIPTGNGISGFDDILPSLTAAIGYQF